MMYDRDWYRLSNTDISVLGSIGIVGLYVAKMAKLGYGDWWTDFWQYAPNSYRLWEQFTIWISGGDGTFVVNFTIACWIVCVSLAYLILRPIEHPEILFVWLLWMGYFGYIMNGPMYLLLAIITRYRDRPWVSLFLLPLAVIKEVAFFIAAVYLFLYQPEHREDTVINSCLGAVAYIGTRIFIGETLYYPSGAQFFLPSIPYILVMSFPSLLVFIVANIILLIFTSVVLGHHRLWLLVMIPNVLFALFWEAQLWFPLVILLISKRTVEKKQ